MPIIYTSLAIVNYQRVVFIDLTHRHYCDLTHHTHTHTHTHTHHIHTCTHTHYIYIYSSIHTIKLTCMPIYSTDFQGMYIVSLHVNYVDTPDVLVQ